ncbi:hypothetical protein ACN28S_20480 [Cystobacter fuscus]
MSSNSLRSTWGTTGRRSHSASTCRPSSVTRYTLRTRPPGECSSRSSATSPSASIRSSVG